MNAGRGSRRRPRALAVALALLICCALLAACAGQGIEVRPRGQTVVGVSTGIR